MHIIERQFKKKKQERTGLESLWSYLIDYYFQHKSYVRPKDTGSGATVGGSSSGIYGNRTYASLYNSGAFSPKASNQQSILKNTLDSMPTYSAMMLANYLSSSLTNPKKHWCRFESFEGESLGSAKDQDSYVADVVFQLITNKFHNNLHASNFYARKPQNDLDMVVVGNGCMSFDKGTDSLFNFHTYDMFDVIFEEGPSGKIDYVWRKLCLPLYKIVDLFKDKDQDPSQWVSKLGPKYKKMWDNGRTEDKITCYHKVCPTYETTEKKDTDYIIESYSMMFKGEYVVEGSDTVLRTDYYRAMPYIISRWWLDSSSAYAFSQCLIALPDARYLMELKDSYLRGVQKTADPPWLTPSSGKKISTNPNSMNTFLNPNSAPTPIRGFDLGYSFPAIKDLRADMNRIFLLDNYNVTRNLGGGKTPSTATEINQRAQDSLIFLAPIYGRQEVETLSRIAERGIDIMSDDEKYTDLFSVLGGKQYQIKFVSDIANVQNRADFQKLYEVYSMVKAMDKDATSASLASDNYDTDTIVRKLHNLSGLDYSVLTSPEQRDNIRAGRMKAVQEAAVLKDEEQKGMIDKTSIENVKSAKDLNDRPEPEQEQR